MTSRSLRLLAILAVACASAASAQFEPPQRAIDSGSVIFGGSVGGPKAAGDTIQLMGPTGSDAAFIGDFESGWAGWTSIDNTQPTTSHWNVSDRNWPAFGQGPGNLAAWCGEDSPACSPADSAWGYGNNWDELLRWRAAAPRPDLSSTVRVTCAMVLDTEPGYDYVHLCYRLEGNTFIDKRIWDGGGNTLLAIDETMTFLPGEYRDGTDIEIFFRFTSDGGWSDSDCNFPTAGACQIDDLTVTVTNGEATITTLDDFQDGTFGHWESHVPQGVGDFAFLWTGLQDLDPCKQNPTTQVAFIDDGNVVPGTGGSDCINWCYGPGGHIVTTTGGLAGPEYHIHNSILSPVMPWPDPSFDGVTFAFDVYRHEDLTADAPGMFYLWAMRSTDSGDPAAIEDAYWQDRAFVYYGGPDYYRPTWPIPDLMVPGRTFVQAKLEILELGYVWGWAGDDGYPAPYFDNVSIKVYPLDGPAMYTREIDLANDGFPARGSIDTGDLGSHSVRFDMARNISLAEHLRNDPGDSIVVDIMPLLGGSNLAGMPTLEWRLRPNPLFDPYRTSPFGSATSGSVPGWNAVSPGGYVMEERFAFDLPDTGFLFPGDVLHYFIRAQDDGGGTGDRTAILPADTTGFSDFSHPLSYHSSFTVRALPTLRMDFTGDLVWPPVLFWNDFGNRGGEEEWYGAFDQLGLEYAPGFGFDYDVYYTNGPSSGLGNGLGGRATWSTLAGYQILLYTCGDLGLTTISNGDFQNDPGDDVGVLTQWLDLGGKGMFCTGDKLASDLVQSGSATLAFAQDRLGLASLQSNDLRPLIGSQTSPRVVPVTGAGVIFNADSWIAYGGCPGINTFDAVVPAASAARLAEFCDPAGNPGAYIYSAMTANTYLGSKVVSMPYDFMSIYNDPDEAKSLAPRPARARILNDVLGYLGLDAQVYFPTDVPEAGVFNASQHPNPFNPRCEVRFNLPATGPVSVKVFGLRGDLVATVLDEVRPAGAGSVFWDGKDQRGAEAASGVYFYEVRSAGNVKVGKMALVR
ncbi:MAG: hypothetical protein AB7V45_01650 [Candidatus Krumholzibacteriia bacterium]